MFISIFYSQESLEKKIAITTTQIGNIKSGNSKVRVLLDMETVNCLNQLQESSYFVSLTPIDYCGSLKLINKSEKYFEVELDPSTQNKGLYFDYFIFVKGTIPTTQIKIANSTKE
jgi:hypothetical protein